jgi:hypothetical protein
MTGARRARRAGIAALLLLPLSYAWVPLAGRGPGWVFVVVPPAELGTVVLGLVAVWGGLQARRREGNSRAARWGIGLGALAVTLVIVGNVLGVALVR